MHTDIEMTRILDDRYPLEKDEDGVWWIKGNVHHIGIVQRPAYCDRGAWLAHIEPAPGAGFDYSIDESDKWPRYYMRFPTAVQEICDWLEWREGDGPKRAGKAVFG